MLGYGLDCHWQRQHVGLAVRRVRLFLLYDFRGVLSIDHVSSFGDRSNSIARRHVLNGVRRVLLFARNNCSRDSGCNRCSS